MMIIEFYFPPEAAKSVNAPSRILEYAKPCPNFGRTRGDVDEGVDVYRLHREEGVIERSALTMLMDWLESEGLWYIWREGHHVHRAYFPGGNGKTQSLLWIIESQRRPSRLIA